MAGEGTEVMAVAMPAKGEAVTAVEASAAACWGGRAEKVIQVANEAERTVVVFQGETVAAT